jgi:hypothetical protein
MDVMKEGSMLRPYIPTVAPDNVEYMERARSACSRLTLA